MRDHFAEPRSQRGSPETLLTRIYHEVGLAAVAEALDLLTARFDLEMDKSLQRGEFFLISSCPPRRQTTTL